MAQVFQQYEYMDTPLGGSTMAYRDMNAFLASISKKTESKIEEWDWEIWYAVGNCEIQNFYCCDVRENHWVSIAYDESSDKAESLIALVEEELRRIGSYEKKAPIID